MEKNCILKNGSLEAGTVKIIRGGYEKWIVFGVKIINPDFFIQLSFSSLDFL